MASESRPPSPPNGHTADSNGSGVYKWGEQHAEGAVKQTAASAVAEEKLDELRRLLGKSSGDVLRIAGVGAGAWGSVFAALLQDAYGSFREKVQVRIWRRAGRSVDRATAEHLFEVINSREDVLRRLIRRCAYLKYVEARLGDRTLYADEILKDGFCLNMIDTPLCPLKVVTNLQEAVWDADVVINGLPSTETRQVFEEISRYWKERRSMPLIISLAKGVEAALTPFPHIITPTKMIHRATGVPIENILYLGGPNIASEIYNKEYANARICGSDKWRKALANFLRQPHFIVWDNSDLVTHEVMGGLKNVYAIGAGMVAALTNESATSKAVYFAHCTSEMIFITYLLAEEPEKLAGPLLADTYVTLLKGRNAWYGQMLAKGELRPDMGDNIKGKGMIQGVSAVEAFYELLRQPSLSLMHPDGNKPVAPVELCPILKTLYRILITSSIDSTMNYTIPKECNGAYDVNKFFNHHQAAETVLRKIRGMNLPISRSVEQGTNALVHDQGSDRSLGQAIPIVTQIKISEFQHDIEEREQPLMNEGFLPKESVPEGCKEHLSKSGNQILQGEKDPQLDSSGQYSEAMAPASPSHVDVNVKDDAENDMSIFENGSFLNADQAKETLWASEGKETVHMSSKELQSFSQNSTGKATCSLVLQDDMEIDVVNSPMPGLRLFDMVQSYLKDQCQDTLNSLQSSQIESSSIVPLQSCAVEAKDMYMLEGIHKNFSGQELDIHSPDCTKIVVADSDQTRGVFQQKATKARALSTGPTTPSNITAAIMLLRKRKSESFAIAQTTYEPCTRDIWEGTTKICTQLTSPTVDSLSSSKNIKGVDNRQQRSSNIPESPTHDETKCMKGISDIHLINSPFPLEQHATDNKVIRQSKRSTTMDPFHECEKSGVLSNGDLKERMKKKLNCKDWPSLEGAGTLWKGGVRRSTRIRSRPLEFWRGERFLYGRIHDCLSTVIGIKYLCPESTMCRKDGTQKFKVQSYVDEKYADIVEFAALH